MPVGLSPIRQLLLERQLRQGQSRLERSILTSRLVFTNAVGSIGRITGQPALLLRTAFLEKQRRKLIQVVSPVIPRVEAGALMLLHVDSGFFEDGNRGIAILQRDIVLAGIYPEEMEGFP